LIGNKAMANYSIATSYYADKDKCDEAVDFRNAIITISASKPQLNKLNQNVWKGQSQTITSLQQCFAVSESDRVLIAPNLVYQTWIECRLN
jgi:hypothetical protein